MMKTLLILVALFSFTGAIAQTPDWKPYFTLNPDEGLNWRVDTGAIVPRAGVATVNITNDGKVLIGYAGVTMGRQVLEATQNGTVYTPVTGLQVTMHIDGGFVYLPDGRTRFITEEPSPSNTPDKHNSRIISWISSDGKNWTKEQGIRYQPGVEDDSIASVPSVIQVEDSMWRMYYVGDFYRTNGARTAISTDWGETWKRESDGCILHAGDVDPQPVYLSNGKIRLYFRMAYNKGDLSKSGVGWCDSDDGLHFDSTAARLVIADSAMPYMMKLDPNVVKYPNGEVACYIGASPMFGTMDDPKLIVAWATKGSSVPGPVSNTNKASFRLKSNVVSDILRVQSVLQHGCHLKATLYALTGSEVSTLWDGVIEAGDRELELPVAGLSIGWYVLRIQTPDSEQSFVVQKQP